MLQITRIIKRTFAGVALFAIGGTAMGQDLNSALNLTYQEQFEAADNAFNALSAKEPANGKYFYYSGENQLASYFIDPTNIPFEAIAKKAAERFNKGIAANAAEPLNYVGLGKIALIQNDLTTAGVRFAAAKVFLPAKKIKSNLTKPEQATLYIRLAEAYVQVGSKDTGLVFDYLRRAEALDNKNPELYLVRGDYWFNTLNNGSRAAENYKRSQDFSPNSTRARVRLGQLYSYPDALTYYQEALAIDPSFAPAYLEMGFLYAKMKQPKESKENFKKYLDLSSGNIAAKRRYANMLIQTEDYKEAIVQIHQILAVDSVTFNDLNRALAYSYFEEKQYTQAKYYIGKFIANAPAEKVTTNDYIYSGRIYIKNGLDSLGIIKLTQGFSKDSTNIDLLGEIASSYKKIKKYQEEGDIYKLKIKLSKPTATDYWKMGQAYNSAKNYSEADSALVRVIALNPNFEPAYVYRARIYSTFDPETKEGLAKPYYEKVLEVAAQDTVKYSKDIVEAYSYLGYYYLVIKNYCESLVNWDKIVGIDPKNENAVKALKDLKNNCPDFKPTSRPTQ
ncbi:MAG: tetratricopeptide repeat protein [Bacteroidota bacterium]